MMEVVDAVPFEGVQLLSIRSETGTVMDII